MYLNILNIAIGGMAKDISITTAEPISIDEMTKSKKGYLTFVDIKTGAIATIKQDAIICVLTVGVEDGEGGK